MAGQRRYQEMMSKRQQNVWTCKLFRYGMAAWAVSLVCISQIHEVLFYKPYWKYRFHRQSHRMNVRVPLYKLHIKCIRRDQYRKSEHHQHYLHNYHKYCTSSKSYGSLPAATYTALSTRAVHTSGSPGNIIEEYWNELRTRCEN